VIDFIDAAGWGPTVQHLNPNQTRPKFAFVIHPLTTRHIYTEPRFALARFLPQRLVEWTAAQIPPLYLSRIRGIRSEATGEEVEGLLFTLGATPREMLRREPSFTYRRLIRTARIAERMGAKIMGLGAFTSVVGDAGITVAQKSAIGITSGNSLTVAATLEAAKQAVLLMKGGRPEHVRAVVIGATGSIGSVCARLLAQAIGDVVLIAPRPERLLALKQTIERETAGARVIAATHPDAYVGDADLIVTTTSALTGKVINVDKLKPGAVVCDVARPPDVKEEDAARRPDVLVIESGEIKLPGEPDFGFDIDMPAGTAYACLSETALLAMDGKFDDYTLGRNIEMNRVKEMYRLMKKHGLELAGLRSFGRYITDEDIAEKRRLTAERRKAMGLPAEDLSARVSEA
jgi:predicted amino acid dehydrogenase